MKSSSRRRLRCHSRWKTITVLSGDERKQYDLDDFGQLLVKPPPKKRRQFRDSDFEQPQDTHPDLNAQSPSSSLQSDSSFVNAAELQEHIEENSPEQEDPDASSEAYVSGAQPGLFYD